MIISGYANFEYAQNALKQGVSDYLLKPINKDALNESLTKMVNQIETARRTDMAFQDIQNERREELIKLRNMLLHDLCHDRSLGLSEDILREKYYLNVQPGLYQVLAIKQDAGGNDSKEDTIELIWHKMEEILQREITKECYDFVTAIEGEYLYGLMNYPARNSEKIRKIVRSCFNQMIEETIILEKHSFLWVLVYLLKRQRILRILLCLQIVHLLNDYLRETARYWRRMLPMVFSMRKNWWTNSPEIWEVRFRHWM